MDKKTIFHEYINYHNKFEKKYGKDKTLVLMQVGSFFEAYSTNTEGPSLQNVSELLNIICTRKDKSVNEINNKNPYMLGFPIVAFSKYINVLIEAGYTIILVEQVTPPPNPKREITNIYSPGTYINGPQKIDYNFISCIYLEDVVQKNGKNLLCTGMSAVDLTTGKVLFHEAYASQIDDKFALDEIVRFLNSINPKETVFAYKSNEQSMKKEQLFQYLELDNKFVYYKNNEQIEKKYEKITYQTEFLKKVYKDCGAINPIEYLDLSKYIYATQSITMLLDFAYEHSEKIINNISKPEPYFDTRTLILGNNASQQLNIIESSNLQYENSKIKSLFDVVNNTSTPMGRRFLREKLLSPMVKVDEINQYYNYNDIFIKYKLIDPIKSKLKEISDVERLNRKIALSMIQPYELYDQISNYQQILDIINILKKNKELKNILPQEDNIKQLAEFIKLGNNTFDIEELKKQNLSQIQKNIFNIGIKKDIDELQERLNNGDNFMNNLCSTLSKFIPESKLSKFKKNKDNNPISIKKNDREGHYLSISRIRSQTLQKALKNHKSIVVQGVEVEVDKIIFDDKNKGCSKITCSDLGVKSDEIIELKNKLDTLCKEHLSEYLTTEYNKYKTTFQLMVQFISLIDYIVSNCITAQLYNYSRPLIEDNKETSYLECKDLRHPIVERLIDYEYIPHDISVGKDLKGMLIYGLNSAGKTVLQKSIGICVVMAQAGMFVPAKTCKLSPYKSLYTRMTGSDNLFKGLSSFALEMLELKAILRRSGQNTMVIGDEICRGTEHVSGNAIVATTIIELERTNSTFIFATHLHEIAHMERIKKLNKVKSFHISVDYDQKTDSLVYDRKLKEGDGDTIYGITVARYILNDQSFINTALEIKEEITKNHNSLISGKTSKYNSEIFIHECQICHKKETKGFISDLQTHHINFQKDCENGFAKNKPHIRKNDKANLIVICAECHNKVHHEGLDIDGYVMTSKGKQIVLKKEIKKDNKKILLKK